MTKPRIISPCVAEKSTRDPLQRIAEFSTDHGGGLISIRDMGDHSRVEIYRCDPGVRVIAPKAATAPLHGSALDAADLARIDSVLTIEADDLAERMNSPEAYDGERAEVEAERAGLVATIAKVNAMAGIPSAAPSQSIHVEFLDAAGRLDHNGTYPTIQAALADADGRRVVVTGIEPAPSDAPAPAMIRVWVVNHQTPGEVEPAIPSLFTSQAAAESFMDEKMREEWEVNGPLDENDEPLPFPDDYNAAIDILIREDTDHAWGRWEISTHDVPAPADPVKADMLAALKDAHHEVSTDVDGITRDEALALISTLRLNLYAAIARAEWRA